MHTGLKIFCIFAIVSSKLCVQSHLIQSQKLIKYKSLEGLVFNTCNGTHTGLTPPSKGELYTKLMFMSAQTINLHGKKYSNAKANAQHSDIVHLVKDILFIQGSKSINEDLHMLLHAFVTHPDFKDYTPKGISDLLFTIKTVTNFFFDAELKINAQNV